MGAENRFFKETIEAVEMHKQLVRWVKMKKEQEAALEYDDKCKGIYREEGLRRAKDFQNTMADRLGLTQVEEVYISIESEDNKIIITMLEKELFKERG